MLITFEDINNIFFAKKIKPKGCFHVGAHHCEEFNLYLNIGVDAKDIVWVEGFPKLIEEMKERNIPDLNLIHALITDKDDEDVTLNIANNYLSSSILEFGTHTTEYPDIQFIDKIEQKSITIDTFFERNNLDASKYDFWNIDIQGAELLALKGATKSIQYAKVIYLEVHSAELYKDCALIQDVDDFLAQYNFKRVLTNMTPHKCGDALYILND